MGRFFFITSIGGEGGGGATVAVRFSIKLKKKGGEGTPVFQIFFPVWPKMGKREEGGRTNYLTRKKGVEKNLTRFPDSRALMAEKRERSLPPGCRSWWRRKGKKKEKERKRKNAKRTFTPRSIRKFEEWTGGEKGGKGGLLFFLLFDAANGGGKGGGGPRGAASGDLWKPEKKKKRGGGGKKRKKTSELTP